MWIGCGGAGQAHAHHAIQISIALTGCIRLRGDTSAAWSDYAGAVVLPNQPHQFDSDGQCAANIFVEPESALGHAFLKSFKDASIVALPSGQAELLAGPLRQAFLDGSDDNVLIAISRQIAEGICGSTLAPLTIDPRINRTIEHVRSRLHTAISLAEVAAIAHLSPSRFRHLFVAQTGTSFRAYLLWSRLLSAVNLAMRGTSWTHAAQQCGFADSAHLSRTFRRMFGIKPSMLI